MSAPKFIVHSVTYPAEFLDAELNRPPVAVGFAFVLGGARRPTWQPYTRDRMYIDAHLQAAIVVWRLAAPYMRFSIFDFVDVVDGREEAVRWVAANQEKEDT